MKKSVFIVLIPSLFFASCGFLNSKKKVINSSQSSIGAKLIETYNHLMEEKCRFHTIGDWIAYGYAVAPYGYKKKFTQLFSSISYSCKAKPIHTIDLGLIRGTLADKEESCLGYTDLQGRNRQEIAEKLYKFLIREINEECY